MQSLAKRHGGSCLLATVLLSPVLFADTANVAKGAHIDLGHPQDTNGVRASFSEDLHKPDQSESSNISSTDPMLNQKSQA